MIKHNLKFLHFDLTSTGLTTHIIQNLGKQLRRSRSLLSIHLSGNPGVNDYTSQALRERIVARPNEDINRYNRISAKVNQYLSKLPGNLVDGLFSKQTRLVDQETA